MANGSSRFDLNGRVALVTGGSRGLGHAIAAGFAEAGCDIVIASRKRASCEEAAADLSRRYGVRARGFACNVTSWNECEALVQDVHREFGRIDILVNNAGSSPPSGDIADLSEALFDKILAVNLKGPFRLTALIGSLMVRQGSGSIINIGSSAATHSLADAIPYSAAKAGLNAATGAFARLFGPAVRVNTIQPWAVETDMLAGVAPADLAEMGRDHAIKRAARPDELVGMAIYLASDAASYTTGSVLRCDGGMPG